MTDKEWVRIRRDELESLIDDRACLLEAAQALIDKWYASGFDNIDHEVSTLKKAAERASK